MASKKPPKSELVAICRLEFYRKQKNWKFCSQERIGKDTKKKTKTTSVKLNKTYSIEPQKEEPTKPEAPEKEEHPNLDEAFVETETGTVSESDEPAQPDELPVNLKEAHDTSGNKPLLPLDPPNSPYSPKWSIQRWAEQRRLWSPESTCSSQVSNCPQQQTIPTEDAYYPTLESDYNNQDVYYSLKSHFPNKGANYQITYTHDGLNYPTQCYYDRSAYIQESCDPKLGASVLYYNSNMYHHGSDVARHETNMPHHGADVPQRESNMPYRYEGNVSPSGRTDVLNVEKLHEWDAAQPWAWGGACAGEGAAWSAPAPADWPEGAGGVGAGAGEDGVDGGRGADWLRHDLSAESLPSVASGEFVRGAALAPHSTQIDLLGAEAEAEAGAGASAALEREVRRHAAALRHLLRRQPSVEGSFDEEPPREPPHHPPAAPFADRVVAGSLASRPALQGHTELGRGRGRLKVIGIGMGRPYRL